MELWRLATQNMLLASIAFQHLHWQPGSAGCLQIWSTMVSTERTVFSVVQEVVFVLPAFSVLGGMPMVLAGETGTIRNNTTRVYAAELITSTMT